MLLTSEKVKRYIGDKKVLLKVLSSSFLHLPVSMAISLITFRVIEPYFMGIWATMTVFETYAGILRMGVINGMNRELPHSMGAGRTEEAITYAQTAFSYNLFTIVVLWLIIPFLVTNFELNNTYLLCIAVNLVRVSLSFYTTYLSGTFRTTDNFNKFSNIQYAMIAFHLLLSPMIIFLKFEGYLMMQLLLALVNSFLLHKYRPLHIKPKFNYKIFIKLSKIGVPLFLSSYAIGFIDTIPRLFIIKYGDETLLGLFSPVILVVTTFSMLPNTLGMYYYPKLSYKLGKEGQPKNLLNPMMKIFLISALFLLPLAFIGFFLADTLSVIFPKYKESIPYLKIAFFVAPFSISKLGGVISVVLKKFSYLAFYVISYAAFQIVSLLVIYHFITKDILKVSVLSILATYFLLFVVSIILNIKLVSKKENI